MSGPCSCNKFSFVSSNCLFSMAMVKSVCLPLVYHHILWSNPSPRDRCRVVVVSTRSSRLCADSRAPRRLLTSAVARGRARTYPCVALAVECFFPYTLLTTKCITLILLTETPNWQFVAWKLCSRANTLPAGDTHASRACRATPTVSCGRKCRRIRPWRDRFSVCSYCTVRRGGSGVRVVRRVFRWRELQQFSLTFPFMRAVIGAASISIPHSKSFPQRRLIIFDLSVVP